MNAMGIQMRLHYANFFSIKQNFSIEQKKHHHLLKNSFYSSIFLATLVLPSSANALTVDFAGNFRVRAKTFDNLSLNSSLPISETSTSEELISDETTFFIDQKLSIFSEFHVTPNISVFAEADILPDFVWGSGIEKIDYFSGFYVPAGDSQSATNPDSVPAIQPRRLWAEIYNKFGRLQIGRNTTHIGKGIYWNGGSEADSSFGDISDQIQAVAKLGPVSANLGYHLNYEGKSDKPYDAYSLNAGISYLSEKASGGFYFHFQNDHSWLEEGTYKTSESSVNDYKIYNMDLWTKIILGSIDVELEAIYRYGSGDMAFEPSSDTSGTNLRFIQGGKINQFGGVAKLNWQNKKMKTGLELGLATGDSDVFLTDTSSSTVNKFSAFHFDRDYHVSYILFRQPLPSRASLYSDASDSDKYTTAITGNDISNAFFFHPEFSYALSDKIELSASGLAAWAMKTNDLLNYRKDYGYEIDLHAKTNIIDSLNLCATGAIFLPGNVFGSAREPAFGGELSLSIDF